MMCLGEHGTHFNEYFFLNTDFMDLHGLGVGAMASFRNNII